MSIADSDSDADLEQRDRRTIIGINGKQMTCEQFLEAVTQQPSERITDFALRVARQIGVSIVITTEGPRPHKPW
jgi:hypothetical protein